MSVKVEGFEKVDDLPEAVFGKQQSIAQFSEILELGETYRRVEDRSQSDSIVDVSFDQDELALLTYADGSQLLVTAKQYQRIQESESEAQRGVILDDIRITNAAFKCAPGSAIRDVLCRVLFRRGSDCSSESAPRSSGEVASPWRQEHRAINIRMNNKKPRPQSELMSRSARQPARQLPQVWTQAVPPPGKTAWGSAVARNHGLR